MSCEEQSLPTLSVIFPFITVQQKSCLLFTGVFFVFQSQESLCIRGRWGRTVYLCPFPSPHVIGLKSVWAQPKAGSFSSSDANPPDGIWFSKQSFGEWGGGENRNGEQKKERRREGEGRNCSTNWH